MSPVSTSGGCSLGRVAENAERRGRRQLGAARLSRCARRTRSACGGRAARRAASGSARRQGPGGVADRPEPALQRRDRHRANDHAVEPHRVEQRDLGLGAEAEAAQQILRLALDVARDHSLLGDPHRRSSGDRPLSTDAGARSPATVPSAATAPANAVASATPRTARSQRPGRRRARAATRASGQTAPASQPPSRAVASVVRPRLRAPAAHRHRAPAPAGCASGRRTPSRSRRPGRPSGATRRRRSSRWRRLRAAPRSPRRSMSRPG